MRAEKQRRHGENLVGLGRLELPTSPLSGVRSNQLSYRPGFTTGSVTQTVFALADQVIDCERLNRASFIV